MLPNQAVRALYRLGGGKENGPLVMVTFDLVADGDAPVLAEIGDGQA